VSMQAAAGAVAYRGAQARSGRRHSYRLESAVRQPGVRATCAEPWRFTSIDGRPRGRNQRGLGLAFAHAVLEPS
jgi:hypothetical protein